MMKEKELRIVLNVKRSIYSILAIDDDLRPEYDLSKLKKGGGRGKYVQRCKGKQTDLIGD